MGLFGPKTLIYDQNERNKQGTGGLRETTEHFPRATPDTPPVRLTRK